MGLTFWQRYMCPPMLRVVPPSSPKVPLRPLGREEGADAGVAEAVADELEDVAQHGRVRTQRAERVAVRRRPVARRGDPAPVVRPPERRVPQRVHHPRPTPAAVGGAGRAGPADLGVVVGKVIDGGVEGGDEAR